MIARPHHLFAQQKHKIKVGLLHRTAQSLVPVYNDATLIFEGCGIINLCPQGLGVEKNRKLLTATRLRKSQAAKSCIRTANRDELLSYGCACQNRPPPPPPYLPTKAEKQHETRQGCSKPSSTGSVLLTSRGPQMQLHSNSNRTFNSHGYASLHLQGQQK